MLILIIEITVTLLSLIYAYYLWCYQYWKKKNVPYIEPRIPFGNLKSPFQRDKMIGLEVADLYQIAKLRGLKYVGVYSLSYPIFLPLDLELTKLIMSKDFHHFTDRGVYYNEKDDPISAHLFAIGGVRWKHLRAKLTPTFTSGKMRGMFSTLVKCGHVLETFLEKEVQNEKSVDVKLVMSKYSTDVICSCAFGIECNSFDDPNSPFIQYGRRIFSRTTLETIKGSVSINAPGLARFFGVRSIPKDISDFYFKVVEDAVNYRRKNNVRRPDFLQLLIDIMQEGHDSEGTTLTFEETVSQCFVFFVAGFETSSTTMTFVLFELSRNPDIQTKLRLEILEVLKKHNGEITYDSLNEMKYLGQVIDETLRKYPPVNIITRKCVEDWQIPDSDTVIEKGTRVFIPVVAYNYDPDYFENPELFDPERFSEENKKNIQQYAHIPFGEGPRLCIGMRFGLMQTKVGLISILKNYKVTLSSKTKLPLQYDKNSFVPSVLGGIWLDLQKIC